MVLPRGWDTHVLHFPSRLVRLLQEMSPVEHYAGTLTSTPPQRERQGHSKGGDKQGELHFMVVHVLHRQHAANEEAGNTLQVSKYL